MDPLIFVSLWVLIMKSSTFHSGQFLLTDTCHPNAFCFCFHPRIPVLIILTLLCFFSPEIPILTSMSVVKSRSRVYLSHRAKRHDYTVSMTRPDSQSCVPVYHDGSPLAHSPWFPLILLSTQPFLLVFLCYLSTNWFISLIRRACLISSIWEGYLSNP